MNHLLVWLSQHILTVISQLGYFGVMLLMGIESAGIPLPSEIILPFSGYLAFSGRFNLLAVSLVGAIGCNLGSAVAYAIASYGGRPLAERYGRWVLLPPADLQRADAWFRRRGELTIFVGRILPVVRTYIAFPAGLARMPQFKFHLYTFLGSWAWCWILAYIGFRLGANWDAVSPYFHRFDQIWAPALLLLAVIFVWHHIRRFHATSDTGAKATKCSQ